MYVGSILEEHAGKFEQILHAIGDSKNALEVTIDAVVLDVLLLRAGHRKWSTMLENNKSSLRSQGPTIKEL